MVEKDRHYNRFPQRSIILLSLIFDFGRTFTLVSEVLKQRFNVDVLSLEPLAIDIFLLFIRGIFGESVFE